ncbi:7-carboxy-7-deazaguanine synthase QueE [Bacillus sp. FJAT-45066]|uniref:7-carboxy-7-deazaguanine synthase QueE n=1 Tax=Bacillus sp. FJAT-45066 TaxID=2011010 RepID=UPI000BB90C6D|nr:7-carboxy-7-deazaguanine synthase QueE [Bacillus sp. FJAT-45066]
MENKTIPVLEVFGPTIQGEGMVIGQKTMFVRTAGCDYRCSWCDSAFTWDGSAKDQIQHLTAEQIIRRLIEIGEDKFQHVTISGGNPALLKNIHFLVEELHKRNIRVAIETQGSKWQEWLKDIDDLTISPKPPSSKMETDFEMLATIIQNVALSNVSLKIVVFDKEDLQYAKKIHSMFPNVPFYLQVGNADVQTASIQDLRQELLKKYEWLINEVMQDKELNNARVLPQLHTLLWGNARGV